MTRTMRWTLANIFRIVEYFRFINKFIVWNMDTSDMNTSKKKLEEKSTRRFHGIELRFEEWNKNNYQLYIIN